MRHIVNSSSIATLARATMAERIIPGASSWARASLVLASWSARHAGALLIWIGEAIEPAPVTARAVAPALVDAPASPADPVPEMAGGHPVPETAEVVAIAESASTPEDTRSADGASTPVVETAGEKPLVETAGKPRRKGKAKRTPIPENLRKKASTLNDRMSGDAQCGNNDVQAVKYATRILQKKGLLPDDTSSFAAAWLRSESIVTFSNRGTGETVSHKIPDYVMSYDPARALVSIETDAAPEVCNLSDARRREPRRHDEAFQIAA